MQPCPYLCGQTARMPLELPVGNSDASGTDWLLAAGYRRSGSFVYTTQCPQCSQCQPTRVRPIGFPLRKSMRRVLAKGDRDLTLRWARSDRRPTAVALFNAHRSGRDLGQDDSPVTLESYQSFLVESCCRTMELSMWLGDQLVGIAIIDVGRKSLSAVYTHFHPDASKYSIGTYAILKQIAWGSREPFRMGLSRNVRRRQPAPSLQSSLQAATTIDRRSLDDVRINVVSPSRPSRPGNDPNRERRCGS